LAAAAILRKMREKHADSFVSLNYPLVRALGDLRNRRSGHDAIRQSAAAARLPARWPLTSQPAPSKPRFGGIAVE